MVSEDAPQPEELTQNLFEEFESNNKEEQLEELHPILRERPLPDANQFGQSMFMPFVLQNPNLVPFPKFFSSLLSFPLSSLSLSLSLFSAYTCANSPFPLSLLLSAFSHSLSLNSSLSLSSSPLYLIGGLSFKEWLQGLHSRCPFKQCSWQPMQTFQSFSGIVRWVPSQRIDTSQVTLCHTSHNTLFHTHTHTHTGRDLGCKYG